MIEKTVPVSASAEREVGLVAVVLLARALVAGGDDAALGVEQEDRAGADLLAEAREPLLGAVVLARAQREDQDRVAREQERHHRVALHRALDRAGVERGAHRRVGVLVLGEGAGEIAVARPDHQHRDDHRGEQADARPEAARLRDRARRCSCLAHGRDNMPAGGGAQAPCRAPGAERRREAGEEPGAVGAAVRRRRPRARGAASGRARGGSPRGCRRCRRSSRSGSRRSGRRRGPRPRAGRGSRRRRGSCRRGARSGSVTGLAAADRRR